MNIVLLEVKTAVYSPDMVQASSLNVLKVILRYPCVPVLL